VTDEKTARQLYNENRIARIGWWALFAIGFTFCPWHIGLGVMAVAAAVALCRPRTLGRYELGRIG
jgi:hypothetical protein